jgi:anthranilate synthase component 1
MKFDISEEEFIRLAKSRPAIIQLKASVKADCSPLELYASLDKNCAYLLESVEKEKKHARFSFVGSEPDAIVTIKNRIVTIDYSHRTNLTGLIESSISKICDLKTANAYTLKKGFDTMDALRSSFPVSGIKFTGVGFGRQTFLGGAIGFCAYDMVYDCWLDIPAKKSPTPDAQFALTTKTVVFDHLTNETFIVITPFILEADNAEEIYHKALDDASKITSIIGSAGLNASGKNKPSQISCNMHKSEYEKIVRKAKKHIIDGDIFQVVLSRRYEIITEQNPLELYTALRSVNPSPYMYLFEFNGTAIIGASPETLMSVHDRKVIINPIAGTCPRGNTPQEDEKFAKEMLDSDKERAEHVMLVDLGRNDVRMVSDRKSVV